MKDTLSRCALAAAVAYCFASGDAAAQVEPVRIVYQAPRDCPTEAQFVEQVALRAESLRKPNFGEPGRTFVVAVSPDGNRIRGTLLIMGVDGEISRRQVTGETCAGVASALSLMTALAIDPAAASHVPDTTDEQRGSALESLESSPSFSVPEKPWHWGVGVSGETLSGLLPEWSTGGEVFVDLARARSWPFASSRAALVVVDAHPAFTGGVGAHLTWLEGRLEHCPARVRVSSLSLTACVGLEAGVVLSDGVGLPTTNKDSRAWLMPSLLGRVVWPMHEGPWVEGVAGVAVPLTRYTLFYQQGAGLGSTDVSRISAAAAELGIGAGYRFP